MQILLLCGFAPPPPPLPLSPFLGSGLRPPNCDHSVFPPYLNARAGKKSPLARSLGFGAKKIPPRKKLAGRNGRGRRGGFFANFCSSSTRWCMGKIGFLSSPAAAESLLCSHRNTMSSFENKLKSRIFRLNKALCFLF